MLRNNLYKICNLNILKQFTLNRKHFCNTSTKIEDSECKINDKFIEDEEEENTNATKNAISNNTNDNSSLTLEEQNEELRKQNLRLKYRIKHLLDSIEKLESK